MASLQQEPTGVFHIVVRVHGKRYKRSLDTKIETHALARCDEIEETVSLIKRGKLEVPQNVAPIDFVLANGKPPAQKQKPTAKASHRVAVRAIQNRRLFRISQRVHDLALKIINDDEFRFSFFPNDVH